MSELSKLEPKAMWEIFEEITRVPRPSKKEEKIREYLVAFAKKHDLQYKTDEIGNVVILRPATPAMADKPVVVLQSHMDMVCEKNSDVAFDFDNDPIEAYVDGEWVKARGTTLGADDGIGMAAALALLIDAENELPAIEALFTVDEETGLTGAFNLGKDMLTGKYLINLDSEDDGEIFIGCAGGVDTLAYFPNPVVFAPPHAYFRLDIAGLKGGHSGDDINKGLANSNKLLARFLLHGTRELGLGLCRLEGGNLRNAIPREASAVFCVPQERVKELFAYYEKYTADVKGEFGLTEPGIDIAISESEACAEVMEPKAQLNLLCALQGVPNGVLAMSAAMPGLVETSTNLASVKYSEDGEYVVVTTSQRSSIDSARFDAAASVRSVFELGGATVKHSDGYPGWKPDPTSHLLKVSVETYKKLFAVDPIVRAIHAGLECGLFLEKYPHLEMISIGPTLRGVHSPDERLEIATVDKFWRHLILTLQSI